MDKTISADEANRDFPRLLREVRDGASYTVTSDGEPVARILPTIQPTHEQREAAQQRLLEHLRQREPLNLGPWSRDEAYDD